MIDFAALNALIDQSAVDPGVWPAIHTLLNRAVKGNGVNMTVLDDWTGARSKALFTGYDRIDDIVAQLNRVLYEDPWAERTVDRLRALPRGTSAILQGAAQIDLREMRKTPYFNEVCSIGKANDHLTLAAKPGGRWSFLLSVNCGPNRVFDQEDHAILRQIADRTASAISLSARLSLFSSAGFLADGLISGLDLPVIATQAQRLVFANPQGQALLDAGILVRITSGKVRFLRAASQDQYSRMERATLDKGPETGPQRWQAMDSEKSVWLIDAVPVRRPQSGLLNLAPDQPLCYMVFSRLSGALSPHKMSLRHISGLNQDDHKLLALVVAAGSIAGAADDNGLPRWLVSRAVNRAKRRLGARSLKKVLELLPTFGVVIPLQAVPGGGGD